MATPEYPLRIWPGTQVVVGSRRTGVVVEIVDGDPVAYRVRYPTGDEVVLGRDQLRIRKLAQQAALGPIRAVVSSSRRTIRPEIGFARGEATSRWKDLRDLGSGMGGRLLAAATGGDLRGIRRRRVPDRGAARTRTVG